MSDMLDEIEVTFIVDKRTNTFKPVKLEGLTRFTRIIHVIRTHRNYENDLVVTFAAQIPEDDGPKKDLELFLYFTGQEVDFQHRFYMMPVINYNDIYFLYRGFLEEAN